jgi:hypothetical protein
LIIKDLNKDLIHQANYNSFNGTRGDGSEHDYKHYAETIISWPVSDDKKQKLLDALHAKFSEKLKYEAQHVSVMVAGPSKYNAKKLDKSDKILELSAEIGKWFSDLERQIADGTRENKKTERQIRLVEFADATDGLDPTAHLAGLAMLDNAKFVELYEKLYDKYRWRKNSTIHKLYEKSKNGEIKEVKKEVIFQDANLTAYKEGERAYIKFLMKPKRQLIVALKSRKWWWNSRETAWSTYLDRVDVDWIKSITSRYAAYV